ncbi:hypothetical protein Glove_362g77 [Diversispora epigaea]|uniref:Uncharacterized protein n=1 Tax=Diversispora epigaea TaxID=1348612 RepID=A0A397HGU0_9GLOM|nr:hypothetical protein Glove_362g77 [Diversispora epigaea]
MKSIANLAKDAREEEEEVSQLREYETKLLQYDSKFLLEHTFDAKNSLKNSLVFIRFRSSRVETFGEIVNRFDDEQRSRSAWRGAEMWSQTDEFQNSVVTLEMYNECGGEHFKEHRFGNVYKT